MKKIIIHTEAIEMEAELNDGPSAERIWEALPIEGQSNRWGDEIYFSIPVKIGSDPGARQDVDVGELGYWPQGNAFCIFFGPTPVSSGDQPRAYSPVNILGKVSGDATLFRAVKDGERVIIQSSK
jgi:hypothetical protein